MQLLEVSGLVKTFSSGNTENTVLNRISFSLQEGESIAIMGQSGSGKSTLLYTISGMDQLTSGTVKIDGIDLSKKTPDELANLRLTHMGFIFQNNYLLKNLNLIDNICLPALKANSKSKDIPSRNSKASKLKGADIEDKAMALMIKLGIDHVKHHAINQVSGGQLQRAAICRALINSPRILFADEPTGALNSSAAQEVLDILTQLNRENMTLLTVTHDPKVASVADRIIYLKDGQIEDQLHLGKFDDTSTRRPREEQTLKWLIENRHSRYVLYTNN